MRCSMPDMAQRSGRSAYFDNLKGLLILLVVLGHILELQWNTGLFAVRGLYLTIYAFHMPLFVFCSGWFSLSQTPRKLLRNILYPYLVWQSIYFIFYRAALGQTALALDYTLPVWVLWYLLSSLLWGLAAPLLRPGTKRGMALIVALAALLGLAAGYSGWIGYRFSLSRTVVFFPFYLLGRFCRTAGTDMKKAGGLPAAALALLGLCALLIWPDFRPAWLYEAQDYARTGGSALIRFFHYLLAASASLLVLRCVPTGRTPLAGLGARSMQVFLLHAPLVRWISEKISLSPSPPPAAAVLPGALSGALLLCALLGSRPVGVLLEPLLRFPAPPGGRATNQ